MMIRNILNTFLLAFREIRRNILRTILTTLGIIIGVASVITLVLLGDSATNHIKKDISKLGSNLLVIYPVRDTYKSSSFNGKYRAFEEKDVNAIKHQIPHLKAVAPIIELQSDIINQKVSHSGYLIGTTNDLLKAKNWNMKEGRSFNTKEIESGSLVCLLGSNSAKELFIQEDALGKYIKIRGMLCKVIGILEEKGSSNFGRNQDDYVIVPIKTLQSRLYGNQNIYKIQISLEDQVDSKKVIAQIEALLQETRNITSKMNNNFEIKDMKDLIKTVEKTTGTLTLFLTSIAAISLIVGGIGIMNIMLVSVTERTKEIGIRLAIGAMQKEVMAQFLVEAVVLSVSGGLIGILLGLSLAQIGANVMEVSLIIDHVVILGAFGFSALIGILFGYIPAKKAARLNPIDALRYE
jgi:putative ABC transport system permease protein